MNNTDSIVYLCAYVYLYSVIIEKFLLFLLVCPYLVGFHRIYSS